nr:cyclopropane fatty acid synthase [Streptomyces tsukubensis NRRL18488]
MTPVAPKLAALAESLLDAPFPLRIRAWDGSESGPPGGPVLVVRHRRALRRLLWRPGELGLARAWVAGDLDIEGDLYTALDRLAGVVWDLAS